MSNRFFIFFAFENNNNKIFVIASARERVNCVYRTVINLIVVVIDGGVKWIKRNLHVWCEENKIKLYAYVVQLCMRRVYVSYNSCVYVRRYCYIYFILQYSNYTYTFKHGFAVKLQDSSSPYVHIFSLKMFKFKYYYGLIFFYFKIDDIYSNSENIVIFHFKRLEYQEKKKRVS